MKAPLPSARLWPLLAGINLAAGLAISAMPERQTDLQAMQTWGRTWLVDGSDVYGIASIKPTYPPHAIVALSPLGVIDPAVAVPLWALLNVVLALLAVYLAVRAVRPAAPLADIVLPMSMFLCWGGFRTLLQFSVLTLTLGLAAQVHASKRPYASGIALGFALMKPQMAAPFFLWALFTRRWRVAVTAIAVCGAGMLVFCLRASVAPLHAIGEYTRILRSFYADDSLGLTGLAQVRPLVLLALGNAAAATVAAWGLAVVLLGLLCVWGWREGRRSDLVVAAPALAAVWSVITFYHLTYGFVVLLPVATWLLFSDSPETIAVRRKTFWFMQAALMADVPGAARWIGANQWLPGGAAAALGHADRFFALALFASLTWIGLRHTRLPGNVKRDRSDDREEHRVRRHA